MQVPISKNVQGEKMLSAWYAIKFKSLTFLVGALIPAISTSMFVFMV